MTAKKPTPKPAQAFRLGEVAAAQLTALAAKMHDGNETATLRELIRKAHEAMVKRK